MTKLPLLMPPLPSDTHRDIAMGACTVQAFSCKGFYLSVDNQLFDICSMTERRSLVVER